MRDSNVSSGHGSAPMCNTDDNHAPHRDRSTSGSRSVQISPATPTSRHARRTRGRRPHAAPQNHWRAAGPQQRNRSRRGVRPISVRNRTDLEPEVDRSRCGAWLSSVLHMGAEPRPLLTLLSRMTPQFPPTQSTRERATPTTPSPRRPRGHRQSRPAAVQAPLIRPPCPENRPTRNTRPVPDVLTRHIPHRDRSTRAEHPGDDGTRGPTVGFVQVISLP